MSCFDLAVPGFEGRKGFEIVVADTIALKRCIYGLRYYVYVSIMNRTQFHADHERREVREPLDDRGINYLAILDGRMVGTIRRNRFDDPAAAYYRQLYRAELFDTGPLDRMAITTKLMMLPQYQGTRLGPQLIRQYALEQYRDGIQADIIDCNEHLIPFFERLGYFSYIGWVDHKEYGRVRPMFLAQDAVTYLGKIRSLLAPIALSSVQDNLYNGYHLIQRLAQEPSLGEIRKASESYRSGSEVVSCQ